MKTFFFNYRGKLDFKAPGVARLRDRPVDNRLEVAVRAFTDAKRAVYVDPDGPQPFFSEYSHSLLKMSHGDMTPRSLLWSSTTSIVSAGFFAFTKRAAISIE